MNNKKLDNYIYPALFIYEEGKEITVLFPDLDVATSGVDDKDALKSAKELLAITMLGMEEDKEEIPKPTKLYDIEVKENQKSVLIEVYMPSIRLANENKSISRTVTLPAWLNAAAQEKNFNFSAILQTALKKELNINEPI